MLLSLQNLDFLSRHVAKIRIIINFWCMYDFLDGQILMSRIKRNLFLVYTIIQGQVSQYL